MHRGWSAALVFAAGLAVGAPAESPSLAAVDAAMEAARQQQMPLVAPLAWEKASQAYDRARDSVARGRPAAQTTKYINETQAALDGAADALRLGRGTFEPVLTARANALAAGGDKLAGRLFENGEDQFHKAAVMLEQGRANKAQAQGAEAVQSYRAAELDAIKGVILRDARHLLTQADEENVEKYAPKTLALARASLAEADRAIVEDRYDTDRARLLAKQAREQASHALHLAALKKSIDDDDRRFEDVMLRSEQPVIDVATALGVTPDLTSGVASTEAATLAAVKIAQHDLEQAKFEIGERDERIAALEATLGGVTKETLALNTLLAEQQERRDQLAQVEKLFQPDEVDVLRTSNAIVLRLVGLSFESGGATIKPEQAALLTKVENALAIFGDAVVTVEGHTDSFGGDDLNLELSQRRADAVRAWLLANMQIPAYRISAMGYGETRPIASNDTADGRVHNRRIDLVIARGDD